MNRKHTQEYFQDQFLKAIYVKNHKDVVHEILSKFYFYQLNTRELEIFFNAKYFTLWSKKTGRVECKTLEDLFVEAEKLKDIRKIIFYACLDNADCQFGFYEHKKLGVQNAR